MSCSRITRFKTLVFSLVVVLTTFYQLAQHDLFRLVQTSHIMYFPRPPHINWHSPHVFHMCSREKPPGPIQLGQADLFTLLSIMLPVGEYSGLVVNMFALHPGGSDSCLCVHEGCMFSMRFVVSSGYSSLLPQSKWRLKLQGEGWNHIVFPTKSMDVFFTYGLFICFASYKHTLMHSF